MQLLIDWCNANPWKAAGAIYAVVAAILVMASVNAIPEGEP